MTNVYICVCALNMGDSERFKLERHAMANYEGTCKAMLRNSVFFSQSDRKPLSVSRKRYE